MTITYPRLPDGRVDLGKGRVVTVREFNRLRIADWQLGCDHGKEGKPKFAIGFRAYDNGYRWGQLQYVPPEPVMEPDPPLKNPYMEGIEAVEGILQRLQTFTREFPKSIDKAEADAYSQNLLEVRDTLHDLRQQEMILQGK